MGGSGNPTIIESSGRKKKGSSSSDPDGTETLPQQQRSSCSVHHVPFAPDEDDWPPLQIQSRTETPQLPPPPPLEKWISSSGYKMLFKEDSSSWESSPIISSPTPLGSFPVPVPSQSKPPVLIRRLHQTGFARRHNRSISTRSCEPSQIVAATERREKSLLLLGSSFDPVDATTNTWLVIPPATSLFEEHPTLPTPGVWEHCYGDTHAVLIGSNMYLIGGYSNSHTPIMSNLICRLNISEPNSGWEICHVLPFYSCTTNVVVCGDLIYLFKKNGFGSCADWYPPVDLGSKKCENWAYIYDTRYKDGWCIPAPSDELCFCEVLFCAYFYQNGPKVLVSVATRMYLHDPRTNLWKERPPIDAFFPGYKYMFANVVSNGILYYLQCFCGWENPFLSAFDLQKGSLIFQLEVDSFPMYSGTSYLLVVSDTILCWINTGPQGIFLTKMSICLNPTPSLTIIKRRKLNVTISGVACCLAIDLPYGECPLLVTNRPGPSHKMEDFSASLIRNKDVKDVGLKALLVV